MDGWVQLTPILLLVVIFWLLVLRPSKARHKQFQAVQAEIVPGRRILLAAGIHAEVISVDEQTAAVRIAEGTIVTIERGAIVAIIESQHSEAPESESF